MVKERCARSPLWRLIHWLGSLQLALILLATIAFACAVATFAESGFSTKIAQAYIYKAPWFLVWLMVLCINLFAVTITRWPWERKHLGFIITHYGIITLLVGAMIGLNSGFEGNVTLRKDTPPATRVTTNRSIIQVQSPADSYLYIKSFDAEISRPSESRPRKFPVPGTDLTIVADAFAPSLEKIPRLVPAETPGAAPGAHLRLTSPVATREVQVPLLLADGRAADHDFFGMATIRLLPKLEPIARPATSETRMVFAKFAPVADPAATSSPVGIRLSEDGSQVGIFDEDGNGATYAREDLMGSAISEAGATVILEKYWPHFAMQDGQPVSLSDQPENPAILVRIGASAPATEKGLRLELANNGESIQYRLLRDGFVTTEGTARPGESFRLGWADWTAELVATAPSAVIAEEIVPVEMGDALSMNVPLPGFRAHLQSADGHRGPSRWVPSGEITSLTDGKKVVRLGYGLETKPLPFSVRFVSFDVPRDEGTDTPADFRATVEFRDAMSGETKTGVARMNRPASFPGTLAANLTGINYKFSQAEWNPRNLNETTLQVLYDPGWLLKWIGSLGICAGVFIQFYLTPRSRQVPPVPSKV
ncbi:MAG: hypothetical protein Fur0032_16700 [Terrimicrobiaceae bacterium]